tara:strand:+ start:259 stop:1398 length:1140 start_codon:yes stop_codon:yes gene_type:complete
VKKYKILHLASFSGNIGDNANHTGFYKSFFKRFSKSNFCFDYDEIRNYFWKKKFFDHKLIEEFNNYDLIIIGGGNFFELWVSESRTGTTIDIPIEYLKKIKTPIAFFSLGVDIGQGYSDKSKSNFKRYLDYLKVNNSKYYVSVRNDGAIKNLKYLYGLVYNDKINLIPDSAINLDSKDIESSKIIKNNTIGFNLAGDMLQIRYKNKYDHTLKSLSNIIQSIINKYNKEVIFFPHIPKDYEILLDLLKYLPEEIKRTKIIISPYQNGYRGMKNIFGLYNNCELVIANRFHSNLCSIALKVPTIGLYNYPQIKNFYQEIGLEDRIINTTSENFINEFMEKFDQTINNISEIKKLYSIKRKEILDKHKVGINNFFNWIEKVI